MADPDFYRQAAQAKEALSEHKEAQAALEGLDKEWSELGERIQAAKDNLDQDETGGKSEDR